MDRTLPYLLIVILLIGGWNESFKSRFDRLTGRSEDQPAEETTAETAAPATAAQTPFIVQSQTPRPAPRYTPTPVPTATPAQAPAAAQGAPFFNDPGYRNALDRSNKKR